LRSQHEWRKRPKDNEAKTVANNVRNKPNMKNTREGQEEIQRSRWQSMQGKLDNLRESGNAVTSVDDLALLLEWIEDTFQHPNPSVWINCINTETL